MIVDTRAVMVAFGYQTCLEASDCTIGVPFYSINPLVPSDVGVFLLWDESPCASSNEGIELFRHGRFPLLVFESLREARWLTRFRGQEYERVNLLAFNNSIFGPCYHGMSGSGNQNFCEERGVQVASTRWGGFGGRRGQGCIGV